MRSRSQAIVPALLPGISAAAQTASTPKRIIPVAPTEAEAFDRSRKVALLVGVSKYPVYSGIGSLQYSARDVLAIGEQLKSLGYTTIPLTDADATRETFAVRC